MSNNFKFYINKNKYIWESNSIRIIFSKPHIQGFDEYSLVKSSKEIMYFYYNIDILKKVYHDYDEINDQYIYKWKLITKKRTHDFPCITQLEYILKELIPMTSEIIRTGEEHVYRSGKKEYSKHFHSEGFGCDDFYEITKFVNEKGNNPYYNIYIGCSFDINGSLESEGIRKSYVKEEDIKELQKCVESFLKYAIDKYNNIIKKRIKLSSIDKEIIEGKLYQYTIEGDKKTNKIDSIYVVGDKLELTILKTNDSGETFSEEYFITVKEIMDGKVISTKNEEFLIKEIMYIMDDVPDEKLKYNINDVKNDFVSILTNKEKEDFKNLSEINLFKKYKSALINRTWMCREEHDFPILITDDISKKENITEIIKKIIKDIKKEI